MISLIIKKENVNDIDFVYAVSNYITRYISGMLDLRRLKAFDDYINTNKLFYTPLTAYISTRNALLICADNLVINETTFEYRICLDDVLIYPNSSAKVIDICKMVNYGNSELLAYPLISDAFHYAQKNVRMLYNLYMEGII